MKITAVSVGYSRLVTGDSFSNKKYSLELTADVDEDDDYESVIKDLEKKVETYVESKLKGEDVVVVSKKQEEKMAELVKAIDKFNCSELPF
jgi:hypothetical protein